jgi:hypothetical protein
MGRCNKTNKFNKILFNINSTKLMLYFDQNFCHEINLVEITTDNNKFYREIR